jgi:hypothetical protein
MQLVEQHLIRKTDPCYAVIDAAAFASKNLYNQATYQIRQAFIHERKYFPYAGIFHRIKHMECYQALPRKVSNSILILIHKNWLAFFKANEEYKADPSKFLGRPKIPGYKDKEKARNILIYDKQALGKRAFKKTGKLIRFIEMPEYKAKLVGIGVIVREESYTSQASLLNRDEIPTYDLDRKEKPVFSGKCEERGLYRAKDGRRIQADVNGSYNTLRKEFPNAFSDSQVRVGQEIGEQQLCLAAWMGSVGRI